MIEALSSSYLLAIGILLIGLEAITFSFILFFIGLGFVIVSAISYFYDFENILVQFASVFFIAIVFAYLFRDTLLKKISKPDNTPEEKTHISGFGYVEDNMIKFDGTYWNSLDDLSKYKDGDKVEIIEVVDNKVVLKKN